MIYDNGVLDGRAIAGVAEAFDNMEHSIKWMFRDDENGIRFVYYAKWLDQVETDFNAILMNIFKMFCEKNNISVEEVYMSRLTVMVQDKEPKVVFPEKAYPNPENVFIYFISGSDRCMTINDMPVMPIPGGCITVSGDVPYELTVPHQDNFFMVAEIEYR